MIDLALTCATFRWTLWLKQYSKLCCKSLIDRQVSVCRTILVAAGKIVEMVFTPGTYAMQLSADVYAGWRFDEQSFAADVVKRCAQLFAGIPLCKAVQLS